MQQLKHSLLLWLLFLLFGCKAFAQDTLDVMFYNIWDYPRSSAIVNRADTLAKIFDYRLPDIIGICELTDSIGADAILNQSLNVGGVTDYARGTFTTNQSPASGFLHNMLYYNSTKLTLHSESEIVTLTRDINKYVLYPNTAGLAFGDTVWLDVFVAHLKAGSSNSDEVLRDSAVAALMTALDAENTNRNRILMGDFNTQTSSDDSYVRMTTGSWPFIDPINTPGSWHNNPSFAAVHTQCPRTTSFGGSAGGGMDDRYDFIMINAEIQNATMDVGYVPGSYEALGNDGNIFNDAINDPANTAAPMDLLNALLYMSDHVPVCAKFALTDTVIQPPLVIDSLGGSSIVISEFMYNDPGGGSDALEFIELLNTDTLGINLNGYSFHGVTYTFPDTVLMPKEYIVVASNADSFATVFGFTPFDWPGGGTNALSNGGEDIVLYDDMGNTVDSVDYESAFPWDSNASGQGPSLALCNVFSDNKDPINWRTSTYFWTIYEGDSLFATPGFGECIENCARDVFEPNDFPTNLPIIPEIDIYKNAHLCDGQDLDWYAFEVTGADDNNVAIKLSAMEVDMGLELYNSSFLALPILTSYNDGLSPEQVIVNDLSAGVYYIRIIPQDGFASYSPYVLKLMQRNERFTSGGLIRMEEGEESVSTFTEGNELSKVDAFSDIRMYPNPTTDQLTIAFPSQPESVAIVVQNIYGQTVQSLSYNQLTDRSLNLSMGDLPTGLYMVVVQVDGREKVAQRIQVE